MVTIDVTLNTVLVKPISNLAVPQQSLNQMPSAGGFATFFRDHASWFCWLAIGDSGHFGLHLAKIIFHRYCDGLQELLDSVARKDEVVAVLTVLPAPAEPVFHQERRRSKL